MLEAGNIKSQDVHAWVFFFLTLTPTPHPLVCYNPRRLSFYLLSFIDVSQTADLVKESICWCIYGKTSMLKPYSTIAFKGRASSDWSHTEVSSLLKVQLHFFLNHRNDRSLFESLPDDGTSSCARRSNVSLPIYLLLFLVVADRQSV